VSSLPVVDEFTPFSGWRRAGEEGRSWGGFNTQALSPTLSQRERELKKLAIGNWQKEVI